MSAPAECHWCDADMHGHGDGTCGCQECRDIFARDLADNDQADAAIQVVALRVIAALADFHIEEEWGNYAEIGERDWRAVQDRVLFLAGQIEPEEGAYLDALGLLDRRAMR